MKVCIAEKPSVAREIAAVIGAKARKDGYFEGNGYAVTWTFGHFCQLLQPDEYKPSWKRWDLNSLPMLPEKFETKLMSDSGVRKQFKVIKSLFNKATLVIIKIKRSNNIIRKESLEKYKKSLKYLKIKT